MKKLALLLLLMCAHMTSAMWRINENEGAHGIKILHLGFQLGCIKDFEEIAKAIKLDVTFWYILDGKIKKDFFDGTFCGNEAYNISSERSKRVWQLHKDFFEQFDVIMTSDTTPLSRIFLENGWKKPQIIWVCNRFDYCHGSPTATFPDPAYYKLIREVRDKDNVFVIPYTDFESFYAHKKGVDIGNRTIRPVGALEERMRDGTDRSAIPASIDKKNTLFLYPRFDYAHQVRFIQNSCKDVGISTYHGRYNGPKDLVDFKAVLYIPYAWSNIALFENVQRGIIHFVPTAEFLNQLIAQRAPIRGLTIGIAQGPYEYCDWYNDQFKDLFVYFDSWQDLKEKVNTTDYAQLSQYIAERGKQLRETTIQQWEQLFKEVADKAQKEK